MADTQSDTMNDKSTGERLRSGLNQVGGNQTMRAEQARAEIGRRQLDAKSSRDETGRARDVLSQEKEESAIGGSHPADKQEEFKKYRDSVTPR